MATDPSNKTTNALISIDTEILSIIYKDLASPGVKKVGQALATVFDLCNTLLLPLKLKNARAKALFESQMEQYCAQLEKIPEEKIVEVAPEIGVPILEKLSKTTNRVLSDLYINLLTNASNIDRVTNTHPRFISIIESLTPDEVKILESVKGKRVPFFDLYLKSTPTATTGLHLDRRATKFDTNEVLIMPRNAKLYFQNLEGLSLLYAETRPLTEQEYEEPINALKTRYAKSNANVTGTYVDASRGYYAMTSFGMSFYFACQP